jgi:hypothetical protein
MRSIKRAAAATALAATALAGGAIGASLIGTAGAQTSGSSSTTAPAPAQGSQPGGGPFAPTKGGHVGHNGTREELLTGDTADKVRAAALAAVPGGTVQRVETDAEGSPYEAHMTKSDGTRVTVKVGSDFRVTNIENDGVGHGGPPPAAASSTSA